ncbi:enoyl-CoA hydratase/isomerase family protein [Hirschia maritima]|uniref:enoyl-CoA hydratase/isomerase family protein n=1 Tax=Hirschia maritima TaxID=1121961 RepID=UPI00035C11E0|nr:enoyl-CoA hydratase/isomerase family protein [Hirschia maritima]
MSNSEVVTRQSGVVGHITLNRPKALHALNTAMCAEISATLAEWKDNSDIKLVVIDHAEGTRGFCAGGDIKPMAVSGRGDGVEVRKFFETEYRMNVQLFEFPKPVVSFIDGITMGGGVGLSAHGSHTIATENTVFAMPETGIGLFPDVGGGWFLPRLGAGLGEWLGLTGARLKGADVAAAGIATHYVEESVLAAIKESVMGGELDLLEAMEWDEYGSFKKHLNTINKCFDKTSVEEIFSALEEDCSEWALKQLSIMKSKCPFSMKVTLRQLNEGGKLESFRDVMAMEFRLANRSVRRADFAEGVRAVVIDKDNKPKWSPASLEEIDEADLEKMFSPLEEGELSFV